MNFDPVLAEFEGKEFDSWDEVYSSELHHYDSTLTPVETGNWKRNWGVPPEPFLMKD